MNLLKLLHIPDKIITDPDFAKVKALHFQYNQLQISHWLSNDIHKWTWWLELGAVILPIVILWKVMDRNRFLQILTFGFLTAMAATILDTIGITLMLWDYPDRFLPIVPRLFPIDFIALPFLNMLIYQYYQDWKKFIAANIILGAILAFIMEPLLVWLNLYDPINWEHYYSFPIYIGLTLFIRLITDQLVQQDLHYRSSVRLENVKYKLQK